jgi:outer membrane immunogenic protein
MRALYAAGLALAGLAIGNVARAADLAPHYEPPPALPPVPAPIAPLPMNDRIDFYAGVLGGGAFTESEHTFVDQSLDTGAFDTRGGLVGGVIGFRYSSGAWQLSLESDLEWADVTGSVSVAGAPFSTRLDWLYNFRARVGYAIGRFVPYLSFGPSFGGLTDQATIPGIGPTTTHERRSGWTLGGGIDFALTQSWTLRAEYLFECLGSATDLAIDNVEFMGHFARVGLTYNFYSAGVRDGDAPRSMPEKAPAAETVYRWTGLYVGGVVGGSAARRMTDYDIAGVPVASAEDKTNGGFRGVGFHALAGVEAGYNLQIGHFVAGFETDFQFTQIVGDSVNSRTVVTSGVATGVLTGVAEFSNLGTVRGRLGVAYGRFLYYVAGGLAYGEVDTNTTFSTAGAALVASSAESTPAGWTIGGGFEGALWGNWTAKFEYLYIDLGTIHDTFKGAGPFGPITANSRIVGEIVRAGLATRFDPFGTR